MRRGETREGRGERVGAGFVSKPSLTPRPIFELRRFIKKFQSLFLASFVCLRTFVLCLRSVATCARWRGDGRAMGGASRGTRVGTETNVPSTSTSSVKSVPHGRWWRDASSGAAAGMVSVLALHPLDVIKTRLQVQDGVDRRAAVYRGTVHAFRTVASQEGTRGFYAGVVPALVGSTVAWGVYFTMYNNAKARYRLKYDVHDLPSHLHLASAAEAGLVVSLATNPIWVVKTRMQLQRATRSQNVAPLSIGKPTRFAPYKGFTHALGDIFKTEGVKGLYKGIGPSLFLISHGALQFAAYEKLKRWRSVDVLNADSIDEDGTKMESPVQSGTTQTTQKTIPPSAFECAWLGIASKLFASTATYPSQVVRSRMQQRGFGDGDFGKKNATPRYASFAKSLSEIVRREGVGGLYKGMVPNVLRTLPSSGVTFMVYEGVNSWIGDDRSE